jgi:hypothetical protein
MMYVSANEKAVSLNLHHYNEESIASLKKLLLRCAFAPQFLRGAEVGLCTS